MSKQQDTHGELFEQIACSICDKPPGMSVEKCFSSKNLSMTIRNTRGDN